MNTITPELYASIVKKGCCTITPELYASASAVEKTWRYENPGYREKTFRFGYTVTATAEQSSTGVGFYQTNDTGGDMGRLFPIVTYEATEAWIKCDIWHTGAYSNRWRIYWNSGSNSGICLQSDGTLNIFAKGSQKVASLSANVDGKHTLLAHFIAATNGLIEFWWDGEKLGEWTGDTLDDSTHMKVLYFQSDNANNLFSNVIISNEQIGFDENTTPIPNQWIQPVMTSAGTWEVSDFAISGNIGQYAKDAFKSNDTSDWANNLTAGKYFDLFFKKKVNINNIYFLGRDYLPTAIKLYQSDDGENWIAQENMNYLTTWYGTLERTENSYHNYYRIEINAGAANGQAGRLYNINIDALVGTEETPFDEDYDTSRAIVKTFDESFDTKRTLTGSEPFDEDFDTSRRLYETFPFNELFDTARNAVSYFAVKGDTRRTVTATVNEKFDTSRSIILPFETSFDTKRNLADTISLLFDTQRNIDAGFSEKFDTQRNMTLLFNENFDTKRKLPIDVTDTWSAGIQSIEISMSEKQISDTISVTFVGNTPEIGTPLKGTFYDYEYSVIIEETSTVKGICNASCCTDIDEVIYKMISYNNQYKTAQDHAQRIAAAIGKNLVWQSRNYISTIDEEVKDTNYQSILSNLFGWSDQVPTWLINAFIRGDNLYVIQRGYENNSVDITNLPHTDVTVNRQILRTTYNSEYTESSKKTFISPNTGYIELIWKEPVAEEEVSDKNEKFEYGGIEKFTGTLRFGDTVASYSEGNCTYFENSKNRITTGYDDNDMVLSTSNLNKETGEIVTTTYSYANDGVCTEEYTVTSQLDDEGKEEVISIREVIHVQLTAGYIGTATYVDGEFQGSTISKGGASAVNDYTQTQSSLALGSRAISDDDLDKALPREEEHSAQWPTKLDSVNGNFINQDDVPVADLYTLYYLSKELENLNRSIQETISCEIYGYSHIIGFDDKIIYNEKEYFLVSNTVTKDSRIDLRQSITAIRWEVMGNV